MRTDADIQAKSETQSDWHGTSNPDEHVAGGWHGTGSVDRIFAALADPTRLLVLELLGDRRECSATTIARETPVSRQAVVKHLAVLDEAGLVAGHRVGREVLFRVRPEGLRTAASWMTELASAWDQRLRWLKETAEATGDDPVRGDPSGD